jgi:hypothetical protein
MAGASKSNFLISKAPGSAVKGRLRRGGGYTGDDLRMPRRRAAILAAIWIVETEYRASILRFFRHRRPVSKQDDSAGQLR